MKTTTSKEYEKYALSKAVSSRISQVILAAIISVGSLITGESRAQSLVATQPQNFGNYIDWEALEAGGLDANQVTSLSGQTLSLDNLGGYFIGNSINVRMVTNGVLTITDNSALNAQGLHISLEEGQIANLYYTFTNPLLARQFAGGSVAEDERISYASNGTAINSGALLDQKGMEVLGLTVTDDSIYNETGAAVVTGAGIRWDANVEATSYTTTFEHVFDGDGQQDDVIATIFTLSVGQVPEPSGVALLSFGFLFLVLGRRR